MTAEIKDCAFNIEETNFIFDLIQDEILHLGSKEHFEGLTPEEDKRYELVKNIFSKFIGRNPKVLSIEADTSYDIYGVTRDDELHVELDLNDIKHFRSVMKHYASVPLLALDVQKVTTKRIHEQMTLDEFRSLLMENKILDDGELVILSE